MSLNLGTICYVPGPGRFNSDSFIKNISDYKTRYPIYLYSDVQGRGVENIVANPEQVRNPRRPWTVNNLVWLFGLKLAMDTGLDYFAYLESDVRVGADYWDEAGFNEMLEQNPDAVLYGSPVCYNICAQGKDVANKTIDLACRYKAISGMPMPFYGKWPGSGDKYALYVNGALGIYKTSVMAEVFAGFQNNIGVSAATLTAWDLASAHGLWTKYGKDLPDKIGLSSVWLSQYGNEVCSEKERLEMLENGQWLAIHQVKGFTAAENQKM